MSSLTGRPSATARSLVLTEKGNLLVAVDRLNRILAAKDDAERAVIRGEASAWPGEATPRAARPRARRVHAWGGVR